MVVSKLETITIELTQDELRDVYLSLRSLLVEENYPRLDKLSQKVFKVGTLAFDWKKMNNV